MGRRHGEKAEKSLRVGFSAWGSLGAIPFSQFIFVSLGQVMKVLKSVNFSARRRTELDDLCSLAKTRKSSSELS